MEMLRGNGLEVAGTFFQKKESNKITWSGRHKTELDLLVVRQQQLRRVKDCKALAGEYVTTQHKTVVFEVRMKKWKERRTMGPKNIKWWKCKDEMMVEYRERVRRKYEELDAEKGKEVLREAQNQGWWTEEVAKAVGEKREAWNMMKGIRDRGEQPPTG